MSKYRTLFMGIRQSINGEVIIFSVVVSGTGEDEEA